MKINPVMLIISLAIASLIAFGFYSGNKDETYQLLLTIGTGIFAFLTLSCTLAVSFDVRGGTGNVRIVSVIFFIISIASGLIFNFLNFSLAPYVIINGILLLVFILIEYAVIKALE
ncbi:hypothetical protein AGMMS50268_03450 [Spirochaetia bacterium]|nr:hypothetical protein AGMMS49546_10630 [Spirochaetia bacterium]GHV89842.1 hypothetical protein AGMMS50268_03450 [Spirochaetia bacterium]